MDIKKKELPKSRVELIITITPEEMSEYNKKAVSQLSLSQKIKGFRPGSSVPSEILEQHLGKEKLFQEAVDVAVKESYIKAVMENKLEAVAPPKIEVLKVAPGNPLVFKAILSVLPHIVLGDYEKVKVTPQKTETEESEVIKALETLRRSRAVYKNVSRKTEKGDRVEIDFSSFLAGVAIEGGSSKQHPLVIGEGHFMPGFENELLGVSEGEEKSFSLVAPKDYYQKELAGKSVDFKVKINSIQSVDLPAIDDNFAKGLGNFTTIAELKKNIKEGLDEEKQKKEKEKTRLSIIEQVVASSTFDVPDVLVTQELEKMEGELVASLKKMNLDKDSYLAHIKKSTEDLKKEWQGQAEKRVRSALVLQEIGKKEGISVEPEEVEERANEILRSIPDPEQAKQINLDAFKGYVQALVLNEKVFEFLESKVIK